MRSLKIQNTKWLVKGQTRVIKENIGKKKRKRQEQYKSADVGKENLNKALSCPFFMS